MKSATKVYYVGCSFYDFNCIYMKILMSMPRIALDFCTRKNALNPIKTATRYIKSISIFTTFQSYTVDSTAFFPF